MTRQIVIVNALLASVIVGALAVFIATWMTAERADQQAITRISEGVKALPVPETTSETWRSVWASWVDLTSMHPSWRISGFFAAISAVVLTCTAYAILAAPLAPPPSTAALLFGTVSLLTVFIACTAVQSMRSFHVERGSLGDGVINETLFEAFRRGC
jgi:urease accessory protein UreF